MYQCSITRDDLSQPLSLFSPRESIRALQQARGEEPCFQNDARYFCKNKDCEWSTECQKLAAEWRPLLLRNAQAAFL